MLPIFKPGHILLAVHDEHAPKEGDAVLVKHGGLEKVKRLKQIKDNRIFVEGDNQERSTDSRSFGWLHHSVIEGRVVWPRPMTNKEWLHLGLRVFGGFGVLVCLWLFSLEPSWPTPDKLLILLIFIFMMFGQAWAMFKRLFPFVAILLVYESFRGIADNLQNNVHFTFMADVDRWMFGGQLPTNLLQDLWWHGHVQWYDFVFYGAYMLHFILPLTLAILIWKYHDHHYWRVVGTYCFLSYAGFLTYLLYPAAPPWMASDMQIIPEMERVSSHVFAAMGIHDFPSLYNDISPNPVAAVPSLHAAYATLFALFVWKYFGWKWGAPSIIYPALIYVGTVYMGEHYAYDELLGGVYAVASFVAVYAFADHAWPRLKAKIRLRRTWQRAVPEQP